MSVELLAGRHAVSFRGFLNPSVSQGLGGLSQGRIRVCLARGGFLNSPPSLQESQQESSALLLEARQEVRRRIQRRSVSASLEVQNPEESIWARALRRFLGFLQSLKQRCWDVLTWLRETAAAILEAICSAVEAVWGLLSGFSSSVGQLFGNLFQV